MEYRYCVGRLSWFLTHTHTQINLRTVKWAQSDKTQSRELYRTAHLSVLMTVRNFSTQYNTEQF